MLNLELSAAYVGATYLYNVQVCSQKAVAMGYGSGSHGSWVKNLTNCQIQSGHSTDMLTLSWTLTTDRFGRWCWAEFHFSDLSPLTAEILNPIRVGPTGSLCIGLVISLPAGPASYCKLRQRVIHRN